MIRISQSQIPKHSPPSYVVAISFKYIYWGNGKCGFETQKVGVTRFYLHFSFHLEAYFCVFWGKLDFLAKNIETKFFDEIWF